MTDRDKAFDELTKESAELRQSSATLSALNEHTDGRLLIYDRNAMSVAAELTQQLLGFARRGKLQNTPVDIHRSVGEAVAILARTVDKRITMVERLRAKPCTIKGDPGQLQQVIMNLAVNAREAMPEGGTLTFETGLVDHAKGSDKLAIDMPWGTYLHLSMSDTGVGMTLEVRERIFEPFFTTKPQGEGTGMGLAMVYGIVKNHDGAVVVQSTPGQGTTFNIYLPLAGRSVRISDTQKLESIPHGSGRILVVDDEETVRTIVSEMLTILGYQVACACDGREAVEHYREHADETDLVLLDMTMPVVDGLQCFKELKEFDPNVKAVIATGHALDGVAQETMDAGALRFIHKPFMMAELAETLTKAMAN
jgi:CheY-like chemotaxis protein